MALAQGSVTVNADGSATGSGGTLAVYNVLKVKLGDLSAVPLATQVTILQGAADTANAIAALIPYITANASVVVAGSVTAHVTSQQLGRDNTGGNPAILAPSSPVDIPLTGTGTLT